jgi:prolyl 4-hydroxylase
MYYRLHVDNAYDPNPRYITFQIYLTDVEKGIETEFPRLGLSFKAVAGRAVVWWNWKKSKKSIDDNSISIGLETLHEGKVIEKGVKWNMTQWVKMFPMPS